MRHFGIVIWLLVVVALVAIACAPAAPPTPTPAPKPPPAPTVAPAKPAAAPTTAPAPAKPAAAPTTAPAPAAPKPAPTTAPAPATPKPAPTAAPAKPGGLQRVEFQMSWVFAGSYTPYFVALDKGYYREEGLDVNIQRGSGGPNTTLAVDQGTVDFGLSDPAPVIVRRSQGGKVKTIGIMLERTPVGFGGMPGVGLKTPKDLERLTLGMAPTDTVNQLLKVFAQVNNLDASKVKIVNISPDLYVPSAIAGKVDIISSWQTQGTFAALQIEAEKRGGRVEYLAIADHGMDIYGESLLASDKTIQEKPDLVRRFLRATYRGLADTLKDQKAAVDIMVRQRPELNREQTARELQNTSSLYGGQIAQTKGWGYMDAAKTQRTLDIIVTGYGVTAPVKVQDVYTNEFLPKP